jgi:hypothetical protein
VEVLDLGLVDEAHRELHAGVAFAAEGRLRELAQTGLVHRLRLAVAHQHGRPIGRRFVVVAHARQSPAVNGCCP